MAEDKLMIYKSGFAPLPEHYLLWPLYGAGLENVGKEGKPIEVLMNQIGPDELLVRHDTDSICFSDIKVVTQGQNHPRIYKDMKTNPVVLGHEVSMTVVAVGENLKNQYKVGDRFIIEADIYIKGVSLAYGYSIQGGMSQYGVIDQRILCSDGCNNNLLPLNEDTGYAEGALVEPWACVVAAYRLKYRSAIKPEGTLWIIGAGGKKQYTISKGFDKQSHPARLLLTNVPGEFEQILRKRAQQLGVEVLDVPDINNVPVEWVDDIVLLGANADIVEKVSPKLDRFGILAFIADEPMSRKVSTDVGRIHYQRWLYVGGTDPDIALAYAKTPLRSALKKGGKTLYVGSGGPIGRMHVQRAIQFPDPPAVIVCTDVSDLRLNDLYVTFKDEAREKGIDFICLNPTNKESYTAGMAPFMQSKFDDVIVLAPVAPVIADSATYLAKCGVMNVFAGVGRGTMVNLDLGEVYLKDIRIIGHSGSDLEDMQMTLEKVLSGELATNRAVAAIGSIIAGKDGLQAVKDTVYPGKVVIYNHIKDMPLTSLPELKDKLPTVYAKLKNGREWTNEAELEFLRIMLP